LKPYIFKRAAIAFKLMSIAFAVPFVLSLIMLGRKNGYLFMLMIVILAAVYFSILLLPCIRFAVMIRMQEKNGYPFETGNLRLLAKNMVGTYLGSEWLIYAGSIALHYTQCKHISGTSHETGILRYSIIVETVEGHIYKWPLSQRNVKIVKDWLVCNSNL